MSRDLDEVLKELVERQEDPIYKLAVDILKALVILYGSAWESELRDVLMGLWTIRGLSLEEIGGMQRDIPRASKILEELNLVKVSRRLRADLGKRKPEEENFYEAPELSALIRYFSSDLEIDRYRFEAGGMQIY